MTQTILCGHAEPQAGCNVCAFFVKKTGEDPSYRAVWNGETNTNGHAPCPFLGPEAKEDGKTKTRDCPSCGTDAEGRAKTRLKLHVCSHPALEPNEVAPGKDCPVCPYRPRPTTGKALILKNDLSPGDVLAMTAAVYSLHKAHPGKYVTAVETSCPAVWENNPDVVSLDAARALNAEEVQCHYPLIHQSNQRAVHFLEGYVGFLEDNLRVRVPLMTNRPLVYISNREKTWLNQVQETTGYKGRFWVLNAGRKADYTTKHYGTEGFQAVVDALKGKVQFVQVGAAEHHHPPLKGVLNLVGKTDARQLIRLVYHAAGVLSGVTFLQHLAAALEKPSVVIMGGREPVQWNSYPRQSLLHTVGALSCCRDGGCWKSRVVKLNDGAEQDGSLCDYPTFGDNPVPRCMAAISPEEVVVAVRRVEP